MVCFGESSSVAAGMWNIHTPVVMIIIVVIKLTEILTIIIYCNNNKEHCVGRRVLYVGSP